MVSGAAAPALGEPPRLRQFLTATRIPPPRLLIAAAGFLARGGVLLFAIPIWVLPTPVGVTLLVPPSGIGPGGVSPGLVQALVVIVGVLAAVAVAMAAASAVIEIDTFDWLTGGGLGPANGPAPLPRVLAVEAVATIPVIAAAVLAIGRLVDVGRQEYLLPSSLDTAYTIRVLAGARAEVLLLGGCVLLTDLLNAILVRIVLARTRGREAGPARSFGQIAHLAGAVLVAWLAGWASTVVCVAPGLAVLLYGWASVQDAYLGPAVVPPVANAVRLLLPTVLLAGAWFLAAILAGVASLLRAALWTAALRG